MLITAYRAALLSVPIRTSRPHVMYRFLLLARSRSLGYRSVGRSDVLLCVFCRPYDGGLTASYRSVLRTVQLARSVYTYSRKTTRLLNVRERVQRHANAAAEQNRSALCCVCVCWCVVAGVVVTHVFPHLMPSSYYTMYITGTLQSNGDRRPIAILICYMVYVARTVAPRLSAHRHTHALQRTCAAAHASQNSAQR